MADNASSGVSALSKLKLDPYERPSSEIQSVYKRYQKMSLDDTDQDLDVVDLQSNKFTTDPGQLSRLVEISAGHLKAVFRAFLGCSEDLEHERELDLLSSCAVYEVQGLPGLYLYHNLLNPRVQKGLLDRHLHRDLSDEVHKTNVHAHYTVPYHTMNGKIQSFFSNAAADVMFEPKDASIHKPISRNQFLTKRLRWMTIGGQYDWTNKVYPDERPPDFPADCKELIESIFPLKAQAAIVNLYSPGDTLSMHRDVSEHCNQPLASLSIGCDALFTVGLGAGAECKVITVRLRSGDALLMSGASRYAWHGVPKVLSNTCPSYLQDWPSKPDCNPNDQYNLWRGYMKNKRININVRQMTD